VEELEMVDLIIIGGGPAGLSAAINAASEALDVVILDAAPQLGGQARESNAIENYLGFPDGVTGDELMSNAVVQARKFGNLDIICPATAVDIGREDATGMIHVTTDDYQTYTARAVVLANGLSYRRLGAKNIGAIMGRGVYYGAPSSALPLKAKCNVAIVGGANSAGQAAVKIATNSNAHVTMFIRKKLDTQMSHYLVERITNTPNIEVCEGCEVTEVIGDKWLKAVKYTDGESHQQHREPMHHMFIFIGAQPRTLWLRDKVQLDANNYVLTGSGLGSVPTSQNMARTPLSFETSIPGVFAVGDVRWGSTKRIAAAIGEGSGAIAMVHQYFASL
jgi:thioredoxin reductase (NADPH)